MLELRQLKAFVAIAEEGYITRAAERLGMQQPPLTRMLQSLEAELGVVLMERLPRGVRPTTAGLALLDEARKQIDRCGLGAFADVPAASLALGQQRIVEIARALASRPSVLLLDEPAAGLRHLEKQALADLLRQLRAEGLGILVVEHDMEFVMNLADRITVLEFGTVIAAGSPAEIQVNKRVLDAYLGGGDDEEAAA